MLGSAVYCTDEVSICRWWLGICRGPGRGSLVCLLASIHSHPFRHTDSARRIRAPAICNSSQHQKWGTRCMLEYALAFRKLPSWGPVLPPELSLKSQLGRTLLLVHPNCAWGSQWPPLLQGRSFSSTPGSPFTCSSRHPHPCPMHYWCPWEHHIDCLEAWNKKWLHCCVHAVQWKIAFIRDTLIPKLECKSCKSA